jgi:hypothetical protein
VTLGAPRDESLPDMLAGQADRLGSDRAARRPAVTSSPDVSPLMLWISFRKRSSSLTVYPNPFLDNWGEEAWLFRVPPVVRSS